MNIIRLAVESDIEVLFFLDHVARGDEARREFIRCEVKAGHCFVAVAGQEILGYGVLNYTFFSRGTIDMLYIDPEHRRRGAGTALLRHMEGFCQKSKLFTTTNISNLPMQSLLAQENYILCGLIHDLDDHDPEIVYVKRLL